MRTIYAVTLTTGAALQQQALDNLAEDVISSVLSPLFDPEGPIAKI
jgi:hypothetical protein